MIRVLQASAAVAAAAVFALACGDRGANESVDRGAGGKPSTVTGCLANGDNGRSLILHADYPAQPQGNERPERPASAPNVYRLETDRTDSAGVGHHVGSRVSVTGFLQAIPVHASGDLNGQLQPAPTSGANTKPQDQRTDMIDMSVLRVTAIEDLGPCA